MVPEIYSELLQTAIYLDAVEIIQYLVEDGRMLENADLDLSGASQAVRVTFSSACKMGNFCYKNEIQ